MDRQLLRRMWCSASPPGKVKNGARKVVIEMWWVNIVVPILMALAVYGFISWAGFQTRFLTRKTDRRASDMYDQYRGTPGKRHRRS